MSTHSLEVIPCGTGGHYNGCLDDDAQRDVVLLKYTSIPIDAQCRSTEQTVSQEDVHHRLGRHDSKLDELKQNKLYTIPAEQHNRTDFAQAGCDDFQLSWSELSFQVNLSTHDKAINVLMNAIETINAGFAFARGNRMQKSDSLPQSTSDRRTIFENLNGYVNSGEITAILGPSGAGKTSLLNALCGRTENYGGQIRLIGAEQRKKMRLCIIPQKDYLIESLTVRENLLYSSKILNSDRNFDHEANIMRVVDMLNLRACFNSLAANISGGEYKRVSIAQELLRQPDILVLDEPTSGLDSLNCKNLIKSLSGLIQASKQGRLQPIAIVLTIHQPDVDIFHMFDHVYCMARGGRVIFDGRPRDVLQTIRSQAGLEPTCQPLECDTNPANLLIEIASETIYGQGPIDSLARLQLEQLERKSDSPMGSLTRGTQLQMNLFHSGVKQASSKAGPLCEMMRKKASGKNLEEVSLDPGSVCSSSLASGRDRWRKLVRDKRLQAKSNLSGCFWYHTRLLTSRTFVASLRDPHMTMVSLLFHLSLPLVMWMIYPRLIGQVHACPTIVRELDMVSMISNRTSTRMSDLVENIKIAFEGSTMFFLTTYAFSMCALTLSALAFPLSMHILLKEVRNGWYNLSCYVLAKTLANFPFEVLFPAVSLIMIYLLLGMPDSAYNWRLFAIALVMTFIAMISQTQGLICGALFMDSVQTAIFLASASSLPQALLSGFTASVKRMPWALQKLSWFSKYRYSSDLINMIRFGFGICPCDQSTEEYLQSHKADFTDVPGNLRPLLTYYLTSTNNEETNSTSDHLLELEPSISASINGSHYMAEALKSMINETTGSVLEAAERVPGIGYDLTMSTLERADALRRMDSGEIDLLASMADTTSRSLSYGLSIEDCSSVRSHFLIVADTPPDNYLGVMFAAMCALLIVCKILLFFVVRAKVGSRL